MQFILGRVRVIGLLITFLFAGCASQPQNMTPSQATLDTRTLQPTSGTALVYYLCEWSYFGEPRIALDGLESPLKRYRYVVWEVAPGAHHLEFKKNSGAFEENVELDMQCEANQVYYFVMAGDDRETHKIVPLDNAKNQALIDKYHLGSWFKDGALVTSEPSK